LFAAGSAGFGYAAGYRLASVYYGAISYRWRGRRKTHAALLRFSRILCLIEHFVHAVLVVGVARFSALAPPAVKSLHTLHIPAHFTFPFLVYSRASNGYIFLCWTLFRVYRRGAISFGILRLCFHAHRMPLYPCTLCAITRDVLSIVYRFATGSGSLRFWFIFIHFASSSRFFASSLRILPYL